MKKFICLLCAVGLIFISPITYSNNLKVKAANELNVNLYMSDVEPYSNNWAEIVILFKIQNNRPIDKQWTLATFNIKNYGGSNEPITRLRIKQMANNEVNIWAESKIDKSNENWIIHYQSGIVIPKGALAFTSFIIGNDDLFPNNNFMQIGYFDFNKHTVEPPTVQYSDFNYKASFTQIEQMRMESFSFANLIMVTKDLNKRYDLQYIYTAYLKDLREDMAEAYRWQGLNEGLNTNVEHLSTNWIITFFSGFTSLFNLELFGGIRLYHIIGIPLLLGLILFILKIVRG